jgi:hypothetical protein
MNAVKYVFLAILIIPLSLYSQDKIETDRPNETETPVVVPTKYLQVELGVNKENKKNDDWTLMDPTSLVKYGISKKIELRLAALVVTRYQHLIPQPGKETHLEPIQLGTKIALSEQHGIIPKTSLLTHVGIPFLSGAKGKISHAAPSFRFAMVNPISKMISLGYNLGAEWNGESSAPSWIYTFSPGFELGKKCYGYVESYGFITKGDSPDNNLDAGFAYLISNDMQLDLSGGIGLSAHSLKNYIAIGFSFRFKALK